LLVSVAFRSPDVQAATGAAMLGLALGLLEADLDALSDGDLLGFLVGLGESDAGRDGDTDSDAEGEVDAEVDGEVDGDGDSDAKGEAPAAVGVAVGALAVVADGVAEPDELTVMPVWPEAGAAWPGLPPRLNRTISRMISSTRKAPTTRARRIQ